MGGHRGAPSGLACPPKAPRVRIVAGRGISAPALTLKLLKINLNDRTGWHHESRKRRSHRLPVDEP